VIAWVLGASGVWGRAVAVELIERGYDVVALGRRNPDDLATWSSHLGRRWDFAPFDLTAPRFETLPKQTPNVLICAAAVLEGDAATLVNANYLAVASLIEAASANRIGIFLSQNARLGLAGLGPYSAALAALWTWAESFQAEHANANVRLTRVIPPRTASPIQRALASRTGRQTRTRRPNAAPLVDAILAGKRRAGRRPWLAGLSTLLR